MKTQHNLKMSNKQQKNQQQHTREPYFSFEIMCRNRELFLITDDFLTPPHTVKTDNLLPIPIEAERRSYMLICLYA